MKRNWLVMICLVAGTFVVTAQERKRCRDYGINPGILSPGSYNAITDVAGVKVGHTTLMDGDVRTGVTAILPHGGNVFREKVAAAIYVGNGFGKLAGVTQVQELGAMESPVVLTNTLSVGTAVSSVVKYTLSLPGNESVQSVNAVVGETNDGYLNDIRGQHVSGEHVLSAIRGASDGAVAEGNVGAGTGTVCFGFKGGIGTSSRKLPAARGGYTVGVLVQTNFGGVLRIDGVPVGEELGKHYMHGERGQTGDGSCMIVVATDAPLDARNLERLAKRAFMGLARTGGIASNGSGDYVVAFSTNDSVRVPHDSPEPLRVQEILTDDHITPLFLAAIEATEEAIINSLFMATSAKGKQGREVEALPLEQVIGIMKKHGRIK